MAITSAEIHNQSFSIDRKGYDVDEVDVFLEHVADEIDGMNAQIAQLENQLDDRKFEGFDTPARVEAPVVVTDDAALAEKDARIADLERQLEAKKADDNAIAQALIIAQRSADEIIANANAQAAATIKDAEDEGTRIVDKAEAERQKVLDAIKKLEDDREDVREDYRDLLTDFIGDATRKLAEIGGEMPASLPVSAHARTIDVVETTATGRVTAPAQAPINRAGAGAYSVPQAPGAVVAPAPPTLASRRIFPVSAMPTMLSSSRKSTKPRASSRSQHGRRNALPPGSAFFFRRQETLRVFPDFCRHLLEIVDGDVTSSRMLDCSSSARGTRGKARGKAAAELRSPRRSIHDRSELPDYRRAGATRRRDGAHHPVL